MNRCACGGEAATAAKVARQQSNQATAVLDVSQAVQQLLADDLLEPTIELPVEDTDYESLDEHSAKDKWDGGGGGGEQNKHITQRQPSRRDERRVRVLPLFLAGWIRNRPCPVIIPL